MQIHLPTVNYMKKTTIERAKVYSLRIRMCGFYRSLIL